MIDNPSEVKIIINDKIEPVTPEHVAELFACLGDDGQASFFNHVAEVASKWDAPFCFQLQAITDHSGLTLAGRRVMQGIGEYSHWGLVPKIRNYY